MAMYDCDALLLYQQQVEALVQAVAGKTFEYLRTGKPILAVAPAGDNQNLVERYAGYVRQAKAGESDSVKGALLALYRDWESGQLPQSTPVAPDFLERFERRTLTRRLAETYDKILQDRQRVCPCMC